MSSSNTIALSWQAVARVLKDVAGLRDWRYMCHSRATILLLAVVDMLAGCYSRMVTGVVATPTCLAVLQGPLAR